MSATMLGCPHCGKPIGSVPHMAGQAVGCPYCRRPFQMPGRAPATPPPPAAPKLKPAANKDEAAIEPPKDTPAAKPVPAVVPAERDWCHIATVLANRFVVVGSVAIALAAVVALNYVVPYSRIVGDETAAVLTTVLWSLTLIATAGLGITALFLVRAVVHVSADAAQSLRATRASVPAAKPSGG